MSSILASNIYRLRSHLGDNQSGFARRLNVQQSYVSKWESGAVTPNGDNIAAMAALAETTFDQFKTAAWEPRVAPDEPMRQPTYSVDGGEVAELGRLDLSLPMGPGASVDDYVEEEPVLFDLGYLRVFTRTPASRLKLARGVGDSMSPTILPNDEVLIDTTQNTLLHSDRVYAASINGGAAIKRLRPIEGGKRILVISDNKTIDPYPVDASEVRIWGRVIRFARDL